MDVPVLTVADAIDLAEGGHLGRIAGYARGVHALIVDLETAGADAQSREPPLELAALPAVVIGIGDRDSAIAELVDVVVPTLDEAQQLAAVTAASPLAAVSLAMLLRFSDARDIAAGLVAESTTYSMLQAGPEFARWQATRTPRPSADADDGDSQRVRTGMADSTFTITMTRPRRHNAFDTAQLEALVDALGDAVTAVREDPSVTVVLEGDGPSFSSGGDLDEFGSFPDPASAHAIRLARSAGRLVAQIADNVEAHIHGWCLGAGIEVPAFAAKVVAHPRTTIGLPEIGLGLIPGAGGTVSLPRRIGRHRTALLALTGRHLDTETALDWGLIDAVETVDHT